MSIIRFRTSIILAFVACSTALFTAVHAVITNNVMSQFESALQGDEETAETIRQCDIDLFGTGCKIDAYMSRL